MKYDYQIARQMSAVKTLFKSHSLDFSSDTFFCLTENMEEDEIEVFISDGKQIKSQGSFLRLIIRTVSGSTTRNQGQQIVDFVQDVCDL